MKEIKKTDAENDIPSKINKTLEQCIEKIVTREEFSAYEVVKTKVITKTGGYTSNSYTVDIKGHTKKGEKEINLYVKNAIPNSALDAIFPMSTAYSIECFFYKELVKVFKNLQNDAGVPEVRFKTINGFEESTSEAIVLENVSQQGFKSCNRMEIPKVKFVELALEQLAKLHALGFVLQRKLAEYFEKKVKSIENPYQFNEIWRALVTPLLKISTKHLRPELKKKAEDFLPIFYYKYEKHIKDRSSVNTICHGDFRANNVLMKELEGEITEVITIDYQTLHYGCPVNDVLHLIYGCTDQNFRDAHKSNLISLYYKALSSFLEYFDMDVSEVYPRKEFDKVLEERVDYGLMIALYYYPAYFCSDDDAPDISGDLSGLDYNLDPDIVRRIEEIVEEYDKMSCKN